MMNVSSVFAILRKNPSQLSAHVETVIAVMESVLGKVTVAVNGDGVVQLLSIVRALLTPRHPLDSTLLPHRLWMLANAAQAMLVKVCVLILPIAALSGDTVVLARDTATLLMTGPMLTELVEVEELEMVSVDLATAALNMATVEKALSTVLVS
jgi:hypothetical protein